ncbi:MAG: thiol peroxidase [Gammaproteobacteria bacterium]|nr:thiol peroxidase [Gammaproteobacteria bacterium]
MAIITFNGNQYNTNGELPAVGTPAPKLVLTHSDLSNARLSDYAGKKVLLNIFHTLDIPLCPDSELRFHNTFEYREDAVVLVVTNDLPFAHRHLCCADVCDHVIKLSMMKNRKFARDYGVLIEDGPLKGLMARSIVVIDEAGIIIYKQIVPDIHKQPDYSEVLDVLKN